MTAENNTKGFYYGVKEICGLRTNSIIPVKNKDNTKLIAEKEQIVKRWQEHFKELLNT